MTVINEHENDLSKGRLQQRQTAGKKRISEAGEKNRASDTGLPFQIKSTETTLAEEKIKILEPEEEPRKGLSDHSLRMNRIRGQPSSRKKYARALMETSHARKKKQAQPYSGKEGEKRNGGGNHNVSFAENGSPASSNLYCRTNGESSAQSAVQLKDSFHNKVQKKRRERLHKEQKKISRLSFSKAEKSAAQNFGGAFPWQMASKPVHSAEAYVHGKIHEAEQENPAVEGIHTAELAGEKTVRYAFRLSRKSQSPRWQEFPAEAGAKGRLQFQAAEETGRMDGRQIPGVRQAGRQVMEAGHMENQVTEVGHIGKQITEAGHMGKQVAEAGHMGKRVTEAGHIGRQVTEAGQAEKITLRKLRQKQRIKKSYQAAKRGEQATAEAVKASQTFLGKAKSAVKMILQNQKGFFGTAAMILLLFLMISAGLSSCAVTMQGTASSIIGTTYPSRDEEIYAAEDAYTALETALNRQINHMESTHPEYEEYRYQIDEISHNPYYLASYFTAKYGEFLYAQVAGEIEEIFREQYGLSVDSTVETVTETKTVRVGESLGQVVTSAYCSCPVCCGIWSGGPTASGAYPRPNHTIAVDASQPFVPMGTKVIMNGVQYVVEDTGAFASYGVQFDVYYADHASASAHGHKTWEAYIADDNGEQEVEVTTAMEVNRLDITLKNHGLDRVLRSRMNGEEEKRYDLYNTTYGNRNYLFAVSTLPGNSPGGFGYEIPSEALSDEKFSNMIHEAEKYLGFPYVWGGASPSTSFDCSGFVSWVINNCGNGWNVGRQTAEGLRGCCAYVSPEEAKPGDLIFFEGTYSTPGASHVGIYVGDHVMIHCGEPIQYTNTASPYWQEHFMAYGRLP